MDGIGASVVPGSMVSSRVSDSGMIDIEQIRLWIEVRLKTLENSLEYPLLLP